jgi:nicotinamidase/pyrazinamidase
MMITFDKERAVLLLVDIQPDFMPGGSLPVPAGDQILVPICKLMEGNIFHHYVATQDWHPPGHVSFASSHPGCNPMEVIDLYGHPQTLWPDHCIQGTEGAELCGELPWEKAAAIVRKGIDPGSDSYSGFRNNWNSAGERPSTGLAGYLRERGIEKVFVCGLARDVCVKWTAEDGAIAGFHVSVLWDLSRPVDASSDDQMRQDLASRGVEIVYSEEISPP